MPRTLETPIVLAQVNHWQIVEIVVRPQALHCTYKIQRSFVDGDTTTVVDVIEVQLAGDEFLAAFTSATTGMSFYEEGNQRVYAHAVAAGIIPAEAEDV